MEHEDRPDHAEIIGRLVFTSPTYTLRDIKNFAIGFDSAKKQLYDQFMAFDARKLGTRFDVPFFLFQGDTDVVTVTSLAEQYFAEIEAPVKELTPIKGAGHFAAFTQPEQFLAALLAHVRPHILPAEPHRAIHGPASRETFPNQV